MLQRCFWVLCVFALLLCGVGIASAVTYNFTDLGAIGGNTSYGYSVNANGQVTGITGTGGSSSRPYIWTPPAGPMTYENVPSVNGLVRSAGYGYSINSSGAVAGSVDAGTGALPPYLHPGMWMSDGTFNYIGGFAGTTWTNTGNAYGISATNQVVGACQPVGGGSHAFYWTPSMGYNNALDLGVLATGKNSSAFDINSLGHIIGTAQDSGGTSRAVFFDYNNPGTPTQLANMPSVSGVFNGSLAINDNDWVVAAGHYLWKPDGGGTVIDLYAKLTAAGVSGTPNARCDINNDGVISLSVNSKGYLYDAVHDTVTDVSTLVATPGFTINFAYSIGNGGYITGAGAPSGGGTHAYLLSPVITPEPSTLLLTFSGLIGLAAYAWRKRK
jgi:probable HAF family extracellular repeat protein